MPPPPDPTPTSATDTASDTASGVVSPLRVVVADDHVILQNGIVMLLEQERDMVCAGLARTGDEALTLVRRERPDVLVVDLSMPGLPTLTLLGLLRKSMPGLRVVVLTMHATPFAMNEAFKAGAHAFVAKDEAFDVLVSFIRRVHGGESGLHSAALAGEVATPRLSPREREVLKAVAKGMTAKEIGKLFGLNSRTVDKYRTQLMTKLKVDKATDLVRVAIESGVLRMTPSQPSRPPFPGAGKRGGSP